MQHPFFVRLTKCVKTTLVLTVFSIVQRGCFIPLKYTPPTGKTIRAASEMAALKTALPIPC